MTEHVHDCVVVGAGPAGSAAALQLARDGLDVVFLERGNRPGEKNVMSGVLLTDKLQALVPDFCDRAPLQRCMTVGYETYVLGEAEMAARLDLKLDTLTFKPDPQPHIVIQKELCQGCEGRPCTIVCPAGLYVWENDQIVHNCEGCLECGSCRAVCTRGAITWRYPRGGYGVRYRWG